MPFVHPVISRKYIIYFLSVIFILMLCGCEKSDPVALKVGPVAVESAERPGETIDGRGFREDGIAIAVEGDDAVGLIGIANGVVLNASHFDVGGGVDTRHRFIGAGGNAGGHHGGGGRNNRRRATQDFARLSPRGRREKCEPDKGHGQKSKIVGDVSQTVSPTLD